MKINKKTYIFMGFIIICIALFFKKVDNNIERVDGKIIKLSTDYPAIYVCKPMIPFATAMRSEYLREPITFSRNKIVDWDNDELWNELCENKHGRIILSSDCPQELNEQIDKENLIIKHLCRDAIVFKVNSGNMINNLLTEQIKGIFSGKIVNWKDVGGRDERILTFQKEKGNISQMQLVNKVLNGIEPIRKTETIYFFSWSEGIVSDCANYNNEKNAIGFDSYYYVNDMMNYQNDDIKLLSINGVEPSKETILNGEYPFVYNYYIVTKRDDYENDIDIKDLYDTIVGEKGKKILDECGYICEYVNE